MTMTHLYIFANDILSSSLKNLRKRKIFQSLFVCAGDEPADYWLSDLCGQLSAVVASKPAERLAAQVGEFALCTVRADQ